MAKKYRGLYLYFDQRPLLENIPAGEFKTFALGLLEFAEKGTRPPPLKSAKANNIQESFLLDLERSRINSANGKKGAEATNNAYGAREKKETAVGETTVTADGLNKTENNKTEHNIATTKESVTDCSPPQEHLHGHGTYRNVLLTDEEKAALESEHGIPQAYIDHFLTAVKTKGYQYTSHYSAILEWWEQDKTSPRWQSEKQQQHGLFDTDDFMEAALCRSLGEEFVPNEYRKNKGKT